ncbi:MAG: FecR domain-containing protein [Bacteroidota bacterium]|nr:FecR domain-containing protein [Bacteroidota bacterium]
MTENEIKGLMEKYLNGTITKQEESLLEQFDGDLLSKNYKDIFKNDNHRKQIAKQLSQNISGHKKGISFLKWTKVAASLALLVGLGYFIHSRMETEPVVEPIVEMVKTTEWGQKLNVTLADGTQVRLNSGSILKYPSRFEGNLRRVELIGEAFFDVAKNPNKPFVIESGEVRTTVLGTSFNVDTYPDNDQIAVTVATGKVKVASQENEIILEPNEQGVFHKKTRSMTKERVDTSTALNWKEGVIHFEDVPLSQALKTLEKWYGVSFVLENKYAGNCHISASYNNELLSTIMESIVFAKKGLRYEFLEDHKILIKGKCTD